MAEIHSPFSVQLSPIERKKLRSIALKTHRVRGEVIRMLIKAEYERLQDAERSQEAINQSGPTEGH